LYIFGPHSASSEPFSPRDLRSTGPSPTILVFLSSRESSHVHALARMSVSFRANFAARMFAISTGLPEEVENPFDIPLIYDSRASVTKAARALHPLAGGRDAMAAILILDAFGRRRCFLPIGYGRAVSRPVSLDDLIPTVEDVLRYL
ncbi:uncharacterized protein V1516DRAFT_613542, partial [Lipomyces oligophaga]|uniref:uncharacterized protein n=1 Tax=Lipomyces oligophaga TaxID=45792 RepID=UPI0034CEC544